MMIETEKLAAAACVSGEGALRGLVKFYAIPVGTLVVADIRGLPCSDTGFFAMHIHEGGSCGGVDFQNTGGHYNPGGQQHPRHAGDLPPLLARGDRAFLAVKTDRFRPSEVTGRTLVIHSGADDFHSQPAGNSGRKIACGVIRPI